MIMRLIGGVLRRISPTDPAIVMSDWLHVANTGKKCVWCSFGPFRELLSHPQPYASFASCFHVNLAALLI